ncbi:MAG TPA: 30S ribosomal protein S4 [Candidatus Angelobacter sp.]|nr:30S ribosomal protein S4 [Candidatus Angelobacter sp.]
MKGYKGPKFKLSRREGVNLTGTTSPRLQDVLGIPPGARRRARRQSDYGVRLRAKQRVRNQYGITESMLRRYFAEAQRMAGPTGLNLLQLLERRLDNVIYRLGFARTRPMARQIVGHGHILVNRRHVNIPSYRVKPGDQIELTDSAKEIPLVKEEMEARPLNASWLERDGTSGRIRSLPERRDSDADIREDLIVEFYAR